MMKMDACTQMIADMAVSRARCDPTFLDRLERELKRRAPKPSIQEEWIAMEMEMTEVDDDKETE